MTIDQRTAHEKFVALNRWVTERNGWITSPPGERVIRIECLPGSMLPRDLEDAGYLVTATGKGERLLSSAIIERCTRTSSGALEPVVEGSTKPVVIVTHAGFAVTERFNAIAPSTN
jgi:hypothetical protein